MARQKELIEKIEYLVESALDGGFSVGEVDGAESPVISVIGEQNQCVEYIGKYYVNVATYIDGYLIGKTRVSYEDLPEDVLLEILEICETYLEQI